MDTIFMNSQNSKISHPYRLLLNLLDRMNFKKYECVTLLNLDIYYIRKNMKKSYKNEKFQISAPMLKEKLELPDGSYYVLHIPDYFDYIFKKWETVADNSQIKIYMNKIVNKIKLRTGYYSNL